MHLLLLRHADAVQSAPTDDARPLSDKGRAQAKRVGAFCSAQEICPDIILTSPFLRAEATAQIVGEELKSPVTPAAFLGAGMLPHVAFEELRAYRKFETVMIVGHEPDLSLLVAAAIGLSDNANLRVRKAALVGIELESVRPGAGRLEFLVPAKLM
jgi:phosphohistidine phosphatase